MIHDYGSSFQATTPLAKAIAKEFGTLPQVMAVALAGSQASGMSDQVSDYDFYVYVREEVPVEARNAIAQVFAERLEINNQFWEPGDEWLEAKSGCGVDVMYRTPQWIEAQLNRLLVNYEASVGYSTCFWWNVLTSTALYDDQGWFKQLQEKANQPFPKQLKIAIIANNYPILRQNISSYIHQIEVAISRKDSVSIIHRTAALLASYFDIIFAVNEVPHPGEKRLVAQVKQRCSKIPNGLEEDIDAIYEAMSLAKSRNLLEHLNSLIDNVENLLKAEGLI